MEIHQLHYFVAVAECGGFRRAAARCNVAQPSLSQQIIKLEKNLGHKLFDRLGRRIALTEAGAALLPRARRILAEVRETARDLEQDIEAGHGTLAVGAIPTIAPFLLPKAIRRFTGDNPQARLEFCEDLTDSLVERLLTADLELAFMSLPLPHKDLDSEELMEEPLLAALPREHPLAVRGRVYVEDLDGAPAVVLHEMHCLGEQIQAFCQSSGIEQQPLCRTTQLATVQSLVALGQGLSLVPRMCAVSDRSDDRIYLPLVDASPRRTIVAVWRSSRSRSRLADRFLSAVREECRRSENVVATSKEK